MASGLAEPHRLLASDDGSTRSPPVSRCDVPGTQPKRAPEWPGASASELKAAIGAAADATHLRCGGCEAFAMYGQDEHRYGMLVHAFLAQHEGCGNAVTITRVRGGQ